jgi:hypothetical protein
MPKRTNEFQKLVFLIRQNLAGGATVTESKMLVDRITQTEREVDVCVEGNMGGHSFILSLECRDHKEASNVKWIEEMKAKHERLPTNALILASRKGFSREAHRVAKGYGIELVSLSEIDKIEFPKLLGLNSPLWLKTAKISTEKVLVTVSPTENLPGETMSAFPTSGIFRADGAELFPMVVLVQWFVERQQVGDWILADGREDHTWIEIVWRTEAHRPFFVKTAESQTLRKIESVKIIGEFTVNVRKFEMRANKLGEIEFTWGKTELFDHDALFVATKGAVGPAKVSVNFTPQKPRR